MIKKGFKAKKKKIKLFCQIRWESTGSFKYFMIEIHSFDVLNRLYDSQSWNRFEKIKFHKKY